MSLLALFKWLAHSSLGQYMQKSAWAFAVVETAHLIALAALGGSLILVHLGMLGILRRLWFASLHLDSFQSSWAASWS